MNFKKSHKINNISTFQRKLPAKLICLLTFIFLLNGCGMIYRSGFVPVPNQPISGSIVIGSEWQEIVPPEPLKPYGTMQSVYLNFTDSLGFEFADAEGKILQLPDKRKTRIEAILFDDKGESYELRMSSIGGGVGFSRQFITKIVDGKEDSFYNEFPSNRIYTKLKIRSEIPLKCNFIEWRRGNNIH